MNGIDLYKIRKKLDLNQDDLGNLIGVTSKTILNWEKKEKLSEKAERLINDFLQKRGFKDLEGFTNMGQLVNSVMNNNIDVKGKNAKGIGSQNFLNDGNKGDCKNCSKLEKENEELKKENSQLKNEAIKQREEVKRLNEELLKCKDEIIQIIKNK